MHAIISPSTLLRFLWSGARVMRKITLCIAPHTIFPCSLTRSQRRAASEEAAFETRGAQCVALTHSAYSARTPWCLLIFFIVAIISGFSIKLRRERVEAIFNLKHKTGSQRRENRGKSCCWKINNELAHRGLLQRESSVFFGLGYRLKLFPKLWMIFKDEKLPF